MSNISPDFEKYGGSYLLSDENYEKFVNGVDSIGRSDGQFVSPSNQMNDLLSNYPNDPREWEQQLGLKEGSLGNEDIHRVDVYNPHDYEPRFPTSDLSGANDKFLPGGKTPGGQDECVINQFPNPEYNPSVGQVSTLDFGFSNSQNTENRSICFSASVEAPNSRDASFAELGLSRTSSNSSYSTSQTITGGIT